MAHLSHTYDGPVHIAIIGGTGLSHLPSLTPIAHLPLSHPALTTPWGAPSSPITIFSHPLSSGSSSNKNIMIAFLARHGLHHELAPHEVPSRANIAALRKLGARCVVAFSAVGSLREEVKPRDFLVPDQVIDRTKGIRPFTYFEGGVVSHVPFADPFDDKLRDVVIKAVHGKGVLEGEDCKIHDKGILVCMEGPQFSTRAESHLYRSWSASVINMSCLPEAKLAREAELSYAMICMSTDYDSWHSTHEDVTVEMVMGHMRANAENAGRVVLAVIDEVGKEVESGEEAGILSGQKWKGLAVGGLSTGHAGRGKEAVERLKWLFPENF